MHNVDIRNYMQLGKDECGNLNTFSYDESACRKGMVYYIIRAEQPFNMMETDDYTETINSKVDPEIMLKEILGKKFKQNEKI